ncbi:hypothetical protein Trydic_g2116 [Trypoxylus dichotomus]
MESHCALLAIKFSPMLLLAYLADVLSHLNDLDVNLQGHDKNILLMIHKVHIKKNLNVQVTIIHHSLDCMKIHLRELKIQLTEYFQEDKNDFTKRWVLNSFRQNVVSAAGLPVEIQDKTLQLQFTSEG